MEKLAELLNWEYGLWGAMPLAALLEWPLGTRPSGSGWVGPCPCHASVVAVAGGRRRASPRRAGGTWQPGCSRAHGGGRRVEPPSAQAARRSRAGQWPADGAANGGIGAEGAVEGTAANGVAPHWMVWESGASTRALAIEFGVGERWLGKELEALGVRRPNWA
jgi:hypothetical protein